MKPDHFEQRLQSLPLRKAPETWREEVLAAARAATGLGQALPESQPSPWWRVWLWPCPEAWAGVAALWCVILVLNLGAARTERSLASRNPPAAAPSQIWLALAEEERLLAELQLPTGLEAKPRPSPFIPRPRSGRQPFVAVV